MSERTPSSRSSGGDARWGLLAGLWAIYASFGLISASLAPLVPALRDSLGLSLSEVGSAMGAWPLVYIACAIPAGIVVDRHGVRLALLLGALCVGVSGVLRGCATGYATLFGAVAVFGIGGPLISVGAPKLISTVFDARWRGLAIGIYMTGPAVGQIVTLAGTNSVILPAFGGNWRAAFAIYGTVALLSGALWWWTTGKMSGFAPNSVSSAAPTPGAVFFALLRLRVVQLGLLVGIGSFLFAHGLSNWLPEILRTDGMSASQAGAWAALATVVGIPAAVALPALAAPQRRTRMLALVFMLGAVGAIFLERGLWVAGLTLFGIARACATPIVVLMLIEAREISARDVGAVGGLLFTFAEIGGVAGPWSLGWLAEATGSFSTPLLLFAGLAASLTAASFPLGASSRK